MRRLIWVASVAIVALSSCRAAEARVTKFHLTQITAEGVNNVFAYAMNDSGSIVGVGFYDGGQFGFVLNGNGTTVLTGAPCSDVCRPISINRAGAVIGVGFQGTGFIWQNGAFETGVNFLVKPDQSQSGIGPFLNNRDKLAYNTATQGIEQVYAGAPSDPKLQSGLSTTHVLVNSINKAGQIAGQEVVSEEGGQLPVVFYGKNGNFQILLPPHAALAGGGFINDEGAIAGASDVGAFIYANGQYEIFQMPGPTDYVFVQALNNTGRVVGYYTDTSANVQRVFRYYAGTVSVFGAYPPTDLLHVALNNKGVMLLSDYSNTNQTSVSYIVHCTGPGC